MTQVVQARVVWSYESQTPTIGLDFPEAEQVTLDPL
jgi:hypothetical protein